MKKIIPFLFTICFLTVNAQDIPNISLENLEGSTVHLQNVSKNDKLTVITFWATWCVPCLKELDAINDVYSDWQEETGVELYAVSVDDARTVKRVRPLVNGKAWDYHILLDTNHEFKRALGVSFPPFTMVVKNNKVVYSHSGYVPGAEDELYEALLENK
ncbi:TlpA disulfide reductase family protein [Mesonia sp. K7]|uniref:TlpA family protein disulfide reductase n=1 Tax=Mesonia sp. K7 TaxID=2218606 RepID=UPI000DA79751|nr:TlpA disulfide reductase family protein [Mesonia sp. K7]PZD77248.1 TlpA family protein disulfide reductase [Mesonia sp. K7]